MIDAPATDIDQREAREHGRRPAIVAVDDESTLLAAVRAGSGAEGIELLKQVRARGEQVALLVTDQRMPGLSGTDYLVQARELVPEAKRVLLTAYADTQAAIQAINEVTLDYYLLKPWDPPEEQLFPVVEDLLTTWEAGAALESGGVRVIGHRYSKQSHDIRDFLARNPVPARWLDVKRDGEAREGSRSPASTRTGCPWRCSRTVRYSSVRRRSSWPSASGFRRNRSAITTTS